VNTTDILAIFAVLAMAVAVLPGTLGILMLTNKIAASPAGARYIYSQAAILIVVALAILAYSLLQNAQAGDYSIWVIGATGAVALILVYGFLMHARFLFQPVRNPVFISIHDALEKFGPDEEIVGVIDDNGQPFAFVARLARRPHIVYQPQGDAPFIMTHCILAHSSMSYALQGNFQDPQITITAALANNMVFYEKSSRCSVVQIHNRLEGRNDPLTTVPTVMTGLRTWQMLYPDSRVWMRPTEWRDTFYLKMLARADVIDPKSPVMVYPLQHDLDQRLPMKSLVLGVTAGGQSRAYPTDVVAERKFINDQLGDTPLAIFCVDDYMQVFDRRVVGATLTFEGAQNGPGFVDRETGSEWSATGKCTQGEHRGTDLAVIAHYNKIFWFVWADYFPGCPIYGDATPVEKIAGTAA